MKRVSSLVLICALSLAGTSWGGWFSWFGQQTDTKKACEDMPRSILGLTLGMDANSVIKRLQNLGVEINHETCPNIFVFDDHIKGLYKKEFYLKSSVFAGYTAICVKKEFTTEGLKYDGIDCILSNNMLMYVRCGLIYSQYSKGYGSLNPSVNIKNEKTKSAIVDGFDRKYEMCRIQLAYQRPMYSNNVTATWFGDSTISGDPALLNLGALSFTSTLDMLTYDVPAMKKLLAAIKIIDEREVAQKRERENKVREKANSIFK